MISVGVHLDFMGFETCGYGLNEWDLAMMQ